MLESRRWVVVDKPPGVLSVPGKAASNKSCVLDWIRARYPRASGPMVVHRLDMDTSGLLVVGLDESAQRALSAQFEARTVSKAYVALVEGHVAGESGRIDLPVRTDFSHRPYQILDLTHPRPATTCWNVLAFEPDRTRLRLVPLTGRTHQLRVHCAYGGPGGLAGALPPGGHRPHPILGDVLYGDPASSDRLCLHATELEFDDPDTGGRVLARSSPDF